MHSFRPGTRVSHPSSPNLLAAVNLFARKPSKSSPHARRSKMWSFSCFENVAYRTNIAHVKLGIRIRYINHRGLMSTLYIIKLIQALFTHDYVPKQLKFFGSALRYMQYVMQLQEMNSLASVFQLVHESNCTLLDRECACTACTSKNRFQCFISIS